MITNLPPLRDLQGVFKWRPRGGEPELTLTDKRRVCLSRSMNGLMMHVNDRGDSPFIGWREIGLVVRATPGTPTAHGLDTPGGMLSPETNDLVVLNTATPGQLEPTLTQRGRKFAMVRSIVDIDHLTEPHLWEHNPNELVMVPEEPWEMPFRKRWRPWSEWTGGLAEHSGYYKPKEGDKPGHHVIFYGTLTREGGKWIRRLGRAECKNLAEQWPNIVRTPGPTHPWVWSVKDDGQPDRLRGWGRAEMPHHFHVSRSWDGSVHLVALSSNPRVGRNSLYTTGVGHWWSHDDGFTWNANPDNPLITLESLDYPASGAFDKMGSPGLCWDEERGEVLLTLDGNARKRYSSPSTMWMARGVL